MLSHGQHSSCSGKRRHGRMATNLRVPMPLPWIQHGLLVCAARLVACQVSGMWRVANQTFGKSNQDRTFMWAIVLSSVAAIGMPFWEMIHPGVKNLWRQIQFAGFINSRICTKRYRLSVNNAYSNNSRYNQQKYNTNRDPNFSDTVY